MKNFEKVAITNNYNAVPQKLIGDVSTIRILNSLEQKL